MARHDYLPFGEEWPATSYSNVPNDRRFAGLQRDTETGLDYAGARYYQSQTGRFTRPDDPGFGDPFEPQSMNLYAYAYNNPLKFVDPTGHQGDCMGQYNERMHTCEPWDLGLDSFLDWIGWFGNSATTLASSLTAQARQSLRSGVDDCRTGSSAGLRCKQLFDTATEMAPLLAGGVGGGGRRLAGAITKWGWTGGAAWRHAVRVVRQGGTVTHIGGKVPSKQEALRLLQEAGAVVNRIERGHLPPNPHTYPHINYTTASGSKGTIRIERP